MLKGSEIHHSQSLPAQKANHLRGTRTMPHLPRRCVISRGSIQTAITLLYPLSAAQTWCQRWRWDAQRGRSSCHSYSRWGNCLEEAGFQTRIHKEEGKFVLKKRTADISQLDISLHLKSAETFCFSMNFGYNDQLRAIIHYQSNLVLCLRSPSEAAMTF